MTDKAKKELVDYIYANCAATPFLLNGTNRGYFKCSDVRDAIMTFNPEPTEGCTCEEKSVVTAPNYEKLNAELKKELEYWKNQYRNLRNENIRMEAIIRTIEALTDKCLLD